MMWNSPGQPGDDVRRRRRQWKTATAPRIFTVRKSSYIEVSGRIQVPPKMESNSGDSSGFAGTQFYIGGSSDRKLYPQTVNDVRLRAGVTVREKRSYLEFPSTSGFGEVLPRILGDPAVT